MRRWIIGLLMLIGVIGAGSYARAQELGPDELAELRGVLQDQIDILFRGGEPIADWDRKGDDLLAAIAAAPGGVAGNAAVSDDGEGDPSATFYETRMRDIAIPNDWTLVREHGAEPSDAREVATFVMPLDGPFVLVAESPVIRRGIAVCGSGFGHYRIYRAPRRTGGDLPESVALMMTDMLNEAMSKNVSCETYERVSDGYRVRVMLGDGRSLPALDSQDQDILRIVPRAPLEQLLVPFKKD